MSQDSVHRPQLLKAEKGEPKQIRTEVPLLGLALPLGQTGSLWEFGAKPAHCGSLGQGLLTTDLAT